MTKTKEEIPLESLLYKCFTNGDDEGVRKFLYGIPSREAIKLALGISCYLSNEDKREFFKLFGL